MDMTIHYIYREHRGSKQLVGAVVRTGDGRLGYSLCHPNDRRKLTRKLAREIALARAEKRDIYCAIENEGWVTTRNGGMRRPPTTIVPYLEAIAGLSALGGAS